MEEIIFNEETYRLIGICMKVHSSLGTGFKEIVYKDAIEMELRSEAILFEREKKFEIMYGGQLLQRKFTADFFAFDCIVLEIKSIPALTPSDFKQLLNYVKAARLQLGLLINFGGDKLEFKRVINTKSTNKMSR
jgi:GxxExxY protein